MDFKALLDKLRQRVAFTAARLPGAYLIMILAGIASLMTSALIAVHWQRSLNVVDQGRIDRFGEAISAQLATLSAEPLIAGDRVRLGVLAQRMSEFPEISMVSLHTIDDRTVAVSGERSGRDAPVYDYPIGFEETQAGYVRVMLDPQAFSSGHALAALWLPALVMLLLSGALGYGLGRHLEIRARPRTDDLPTGPTTEDGEPEADGGAQYFVVINLFNQMALPSAIRGQVVGRCLKRVEQVARLYRAECTELPGTGFVLLLSQRDETDFCFRALCAALLCADLLEELNDGDFARLETPLIFRFGLHLVSAGEDDGGDLTPEIPWLDSAAELADTELSADGILLSAVAGNGAIAMSADAFATLERPDRCLWRHQRAPVLATLNTAIPGICTLVTDLTDAYRVLLDNEVELLLAQSASTARASTF